MGTRWVRVIFRINRGYLDPITERYLLTEGTTKHATMSNGKVGNALYSDADRARQKESVYRKLYSSLFERKRSVIQALQNEENSAFDEERFHMQKVFQTEVTNLFIGACLSCTTFATLRLLPKFLMQRFGGTAKARALREAEKQAKKRGTEATQNFVGKKSKKFCRCIWIKLWTSS